MFDAKSSKLFGPIMAAFATFLGLDQETTTETEIHAALDGAVPLAEQIETAKSEAIAAVNAKLEALTGEVEGLKGQVTSLEERAEVAEALAATKDTRIAELQVEISEGTSAVESLKAQHKTETSNLSGQIAKLKAGKALESDLNDDTHDAGKRDQNGTSVVVLQGSKLRGLVTKKSEN